MRSVCARMWKTLSARIESRSIIAPAVLELCHASRANATAADAGIREGDIITEVNGRHLTSTEEFGKIVSGARKGDYLKLYVFNPRANVSRFALVKIGD